VFFIILCILFFTYNIGHTQNTIEKYGQSKSEPLDGGFFFYDNEYIEAPYVVERIGLEIFINGYKVGFVPEPYDWRILEDPGSPPADSKLPACIPNPNSEYYNTYWGLKYRYLRASKDEKQANKEFTEIMKSVPGVAKIETNPGNSKYMTIYYDSGQTQIFDWFPDNFEGIEYAPVSNKDELINKAEESRLFYEKRFKNNNGFFDRSKGGNMTMGALAALRVIDVLVSEATPEGRIKALEAQGSPRLLMDPWKSQLQNIRITPQLVERAKRIRNEIEIQKNVKDAISIGRGSENILTRPENVAGNIDIIPDSSEKPANDSSYNTNNYQSTNQDEKNTVKKATKTSSASDTYSIEAFGLNTILPLFIMVVFFCAGIFILLGFWKGKSSRSKYKRYSIVLLCVLTGYYSIILIWGYHTKNTFFPLKIFSMKENKSKKLDKESFKKISDTFIRRCAAYKVNKSPSDLTDEDFAHITDISIGNNQLFDMTLMEKFINLHTLTLGDDLSGNKSPFQELPDSGYLNLKPLGVLLNLQELQLAGKMVSNIEPLTNLINLKTLTLFVTQVTDIEPIKNLVNLQELHLVHSPITNLEPIKDLTNLKILRIMSTHVSDLEPIKKLINLETLDMSGTEVSNLEPVKELKNLKTLILPMKTQITDKQVQELREALPNVKISR
jgi:hypothetical protein